MNESPAPTVSLMVTLGAGAETRLPLSHNAAPPAPPRDADSRRISCFRQGCAGFVKSPKASWRSHHRFARTHPRSKPTKFVIVEFDDIGMFRQLHDQLRLAEGSAEGCKMPFSYFIFPYK